MPSTTVLLQFAVASTLLAVTPGPSIVLLLAVGADRGRRAGVATALGLALGTSAWGAVAAAGLGTLLATRPGLLSLVTAAGGCYLLWLAADRFRAARVTAPARTAGGAVADASGTHRAAFRDGIVVNLFNPQLVLFLAAIIPPFLDVDGPPVWGQVLVLTGVLVAISTVVNVGVGLLGAAVGRRSRRWVGSRRTVVAAAATYAALGLLALAAAVLR